ncbi:DUF4352 domain-containing protein [Halorussus gelatinilyticus]|uniref:DUF4352 domain-containing protein n=1 Tax=Halorussus gelatinilyticus TaxID=2937524 RepID=A0A8U0IJD5_9EURY|nr:DUF4352 domain-containing protein [Halorussus gelatinilyticus]UPW00179.1 DUF4352 domain-containing protein [Halorussus gelatinilyticus]
MHRRKLIAALGAGLFAGCTGSESTTPTTDETTKRALTTDTQTTTATTDADSTTSDDGTTEDETTTDGTSAKSIQVGDRVDDDRMSMVVRGVEKTEKLGEFSKAASGNTFVVVRLAVKNTTKDTYLNFSGFLQTLLKDGSGYTYEQTITASGQTFTGGQLVPGEVARGDLVYEVPKDASDLTLQFDFGTVSFLTVDRVTVDLESKANSAADLEQSLRVDVRDTGESVENGGVTVAVNGVKFAKKLGEFTAAGDGKEYAIVDITTTNETGSSQSISTALQMLAKDGRGRTYPMSISAAASLDRSYDEASPLADGEKRRGKVAYEVPKGVSPLYWAFEYSLWTDGDKTFWKLR